eukprot:5127709-Pyramimonas_sp.AAC.1
MAAAVEVILHVSLPQPSSLDALQVRCTKDRVNGEEAWRTSDYDEWLCCVVLRVLAGKEDPSFPAPPRSAIAGGRARKLGWPSE